MSDQRIQTLDEIVPSITLQVLLKGAMRMNFPQERIDIHRYLAAFASASARYCDGVIDTKALRRYFQQVCGWPEFKAAWFMAQLEEALARCPSKGVLRPSEMLENAAVPD